jgi:hypothetical protein
MKIIPKAPSKKTPPNQSKLKPFESMILTARIDHISYRNLKKRLLVEEGVTVSLDALKSFCDIRERRAKRGKYLEKYLTMKRLHEKKIGKQIPVTKDTSKKKAMWKFDLDEIKREDAG